MSPSLPSLVGADGVMRVEDCVTLTRLKVARGVSAFALDDLFTFINKKKNPDMCVFNRNFDVCSLEMGHV